MEKAKYIQNKESTLFNDLDKTHKKLKEIANWYALSNYDINFIDAKNQKLYIEKINNIYHEMKNLLTATRNFEILGRYENIITEYKLDSLEELEEVFRSKDGNE